jgi:hypothetical protein
MCDLLEFCIDAVDPRVGRDEFEKQHGGQGQ